MAMGEDRVRDKEGDTAGDSGIHVVGDTGKDMVKETGKN